jgi:hypothetical protein
MENIEGPTTSAAGLAQDLGLSPWSAWRWRIRLALLRLRRKLPYLVWDGDELDVTVSLIAHPLGGDGPLEPLWAIEDALRGIGIDFDTGCGGGGRDWEWDASLRGPISIQFRGRARCPETRTARPKPRLVVSNDAA